MKKYEKAEIAVEKFCTSDIIKTSGFITSNFIKGNDVENAGQTSFLSAWRNFFSE